MKPTFEPAFTPSIVAAPYLTTGLTTGPAKHTRSKPRLRKHADYQRVYKSSRKHFSASMTYFFCVRAADAASDPACKLPNGPRVGLTAGRVMGKAVERNRIKRRMREAVRHHVAELPQNVDVILHPKRSVLSIDFVKLSAEVGRVFTIIRKNFEDTSPRTERKQD